MNGKRMRTGCAVICEAVLVIVALAASGTAQPAGPDPERAARARIPLAELPLVPLGPTQPTRTVTGRVEAQAQLDEARELVESGAYDRAVEVLDAALDTAGGSYELLHLLARAQAARGRYGQARLAAEHAAVYRPGSADVYYLLGRLHRERGRKEDALAALLTATRAAEHEPENPRVTAAWYEFGEGLAEAGYLQAAAEAFTAFDRAAWEGHPEHRRADEVSGILAQHPHGAIEERLDLLRRLGELEACVAAARWAAESRPEEAYLSRLYVRTLLDLGRAAEAFAYCRANLGAAGAGDAGESAVGAALVGLAIEAAQQAGQVEAWVSELRGAVAAGRERAFAARLAARLEDVGAHAAAAQLWEAVYEAQPNAAEAAWGLAGARQQTGDLAGALDALVRFVRDNPGTTTLAPERIAGWMTGRGATERLLQLIEQRTRAQAADFATLVVLGTAAAAAGEVSLARELLDAALVQRPEFAPAHVVAGRMLLTACAWAQAHEHARQALEINRALADAHFLQAEAYAGLDEHEEAEAAFETALKLKPDELEYLLTYAHFLRRTGDLLAAQRYFQRAWMVSPTCGPAVEDLVESYLGAGKIEIARACLQEAEASDLPEDVLRRLRTALQYANSALQEPHIAELERQFKDYPEDTRTGLNLAAGLFLHQRIDDAYDVITQVLARRKGADSEALRQQLRARNLMVRLQLRRYELDEAIANLEELTTCYPHRSHLLDLLADVYLAAFRVDEARAVLRRILERPVAEGMREQTRAQLLASYLDFEQYDEALALAEEWVAAEPDEDTWMRAKMRVLLVAERFGEAREIARRRLEPLTREFQEGLERYQALAGRIQDGQEIPGGRAQVEALEAELTEQLARLQQRREEFVQVCMESRALIELELELRAWLADQPDNPQIRAWLIETYLAADRPEDAANALREYRPTSPADILRTYGWRTRALAAQGQVETAVAELQSLLAESFVRDNALLTSQVRSQLIAILVDEAEAPDRALELLAQWLADTPADDEITRYELLVLQRFAYQIADRDDDMLATTEALLELEPHDPGLNNDLGYSWVDRGLHVRRALEMIKRAVASEPLNAAYLDSLGWAYYKLADYHRAYEYLGRAARLRDGQDPVIYDHLGDAAYRLGDVPTARSHWQRSLEMLQEQDPAERLAVHTELMATLRGKLAAMQQGEPPHVAAPARDQGGAHP